MMKQNNKYEFEKSGAIIFIVSIVSSLVNYIYQIIMGNLMGPEDFGLLNTLLSLNMVVSVPTGAILAVATKFSAHYSSTNESEKIAFILKKITVWGAVGGLITLVVGFLFIESIANIMDIDNKYYILVMLLTTLLAFIYAGGTGFLLGLKKFFFHSFVNVITNVIKLLFSVIFIIMGYGLFGSLIAVLISAFAVLFYVFIVLKKYLVIKSTKLVDFNISELFEYFKSVFLIQFIVLFLTNGDILLIRANSGNEFEVGLYSSAIILAKIPMFLTSAIVMPLFPIVAQKFANKENTLSLLIKAIIYGAVISGGSVFFLNSRLGYFFVELFFGNEYAGNERYLLISGIFVLSIVLVTTLINYCMAINKTKRISISLLIATILIIVLLPFMNGNINLMLVTMSITILLAFVINMLFLLLDNKQKDRL